MIESLLSTTNTALGVLGIGKLIPKDIPSAVLIGVVTYAIASKFTDDKIITIGLGAALGKIVSDSMYDARQKSAIMPPKSTASEGA